MNSQRPGFLLTPALLGLALLMSACAYYNTFYNAKSYYRDGVNLIAQKQVSKAKPKFEKTIEKSARVISNWPRSAWVDDATYLIGMSYYHLGQYGRAARQFEQLSLAFPRSPLVPHAELQRGLALFRDGEYGLALVVLENLRHRYPRMADAAAYHVAASYYDREDYTRAVDSLAAFVQHYPRSRYVPLATEQLAASCMRLRRWEQAEYWYRRLVQIARDPKQQISARLELAEAMLEQAKYDIAAEQAKQILGRYRDLDDRARLILGKAEYEQGKHKQALETWSRIRSSSDFGAEAFFRIGRHYEERGDFVRARAYYDTAKTRRADSDYGMLAVKRLALLDAVAGGDLTGRSSAKARFLLAEVHNLNLGDYDGAMQLYQSIYDSFPDTDWAPKALLANAWILRKVKADSGSAALLLKKIIAEYPDTEYADEARRWMGLPVPKRVAAPSKQTIPAESAGSGLGSEPQRISNSETNKQEPNTLFPQMPDKFLTPESTEAEPDSID